MLQYFIPRKSRKNEPIASQAQLLSVCEIDASHGKLPRTMHAHEDRAEIILATGGHGSFTIDTGHYLATKGDVLFFDPGILHDETTIDGDLTTSCLAVSAFQLPGRQKNEMVGHLYAPQLSLGAQFEDVQALFRSLTHLATAGDDVPVLDQLTCAILCKLDEELTRHGQEPLPQEDSLGLTVKAYIDAHYREEITLKSIASDMNFNSYYLAHAFREHIGYSPM